MTKLKVTVTYYFIPYFYHFFIVCEPHVKYIDLAIIL
jgi:hypothetical protein